MQKSETYDIGRCGAEHVRGTGFAITLALKISQVLGKHVFDLPGLHRHHSCFTIFVRADIVVNRENVTILIVDHRCLLEESLCMLPSFVFIAVLQLRGVRSVAIPSSRG